jgi:hypothetical protein
VWKRRELVNADERDGVVGRIMMLGLALFTILTALLLTAAVMATARARTHIGNSA